MQPQTSRNGTEGTRHPRSPNAQRGVRVRIYPTAKAQAELARRLEARQTLWNKICDVFDRDHARRNAEDTGGLTIACTRAALVEEVLRARTDPRQGWIHPLSRWTCERVVKQAFQARTNAFAGHARHPHARPWRASGPGSWCTYYDGRTSDRHYVPNHALHLPGLETLKVRTGAGHMPARIAGNPTITASRDACARWWLSFTVPGTSAKPATHVLDEDAIGGLDAGLKKLLTDHTGHGAATAKERRARERCIRTQRNARKGRARARALGHASDDGARRKRRRASKQTALAPVYAPGGAVAQQRAATRAAKADKAARAREHARAARERKARDQADAHASTPTRDRGGRNPTRKSRKTKHKGKGSGAGRRRPTHRRDHTERKGRRLDRTVSRRQQGSKRQHKARFARAKHHAHTAEHRHDVLHQTSNDTLGRWAALVIEALNLRGLARGWLGKALLDAGLGTLLHQLRYKAAWRGVPLTTCPTHYPSSQLCSHCGHQYRELTLSMRTWTCPACATHHHRDTNAGRNIKAYGIAHWRADGHIIRTSRTHRLGGTAPGPGPRERPGSAHSVAGTDPIRPGTAQRTSNREQVTHELSGTVRT